VGAEVRKAAKFLVSIKPPQVHTGPDQLLPISPGYATRDFGQESDPQRGLPASEACMPAEHPRRSQTAQSHRARREVGYGEPSRAEHHAVLNNSLTGTSHPQIN